MLYLKFGFKAFCTNEAEKVLSHCPVHISTMSMYNAEKKGLLERVSKKTAKEERQAAGKPWHHAMMFHRVTQKGRDETERIVQDGKTLTKFFLKYKPKFDSHGMRKY